MPKEMSPLLKSLEDFRVRLIKETGYSSEDLSYVPEINFRNKQTGPLEIDGFPVFRFSYPGTLPLYDAHDKEFQGLIRRMYLEATFNQYDFNVIEIRFECAVIVIEHHFRDASIRDLDNRNRKYLIDAVRATGLIPDDNAQVLTLFEEAYLTKKDPYIDVFVLERKNFIRFLDWRSRKGNDEHDEIIFRNVDINTIKEIVKREKDSILVSGGSNPYWD
ncbi:hypothetical protein MXL46_09225 [Heyndrickxia sporothermodurans]|uniref:hypothetical protein n=1 Tax=Heyndrickxia sporothermodurans TaxID=46224 RepID=UPI002DB98D3F|nr:hypothetical protein [Heyndrickxia sporothermodurans]MEB6549274.1 hypothetical protein [Heyndrickxia sporothermodurans]